MTLKELSQLYYLNREIEMDKRRLQELSDAANKVEEAQAELEAEKVELEDTKKDLDDTQAEMNEKSKESEALLQELLQKADDLQALEEECKEQENAFLKQIAAMEVQFGYASSMAVVTAVILGIVTLIYLKVSKKMQEVEE